MIAQQGFLFRDSALCDETADQSVNAELTIRVLRETGDELLRQLLAIQAENYRLQSELNALRSNLV